MPGSYLNCEYCPVASDEMELIIARFDHFEKLADIQMLAMLSCIFSEPAAREGVSNALMGSKQEVSTFSPSVSCGSRGCRLCRVGNVADMYSCG